VAKADGYQTSWVKANAPGRVSIQLEPASSVEGTVVDEATGEPLGDAVVTIDDRRGDVTSADGRFRITGLDAGRHTVAAHSSRGYGLAPSFKLELGGHVDDIVIRVADGR
jgi:hypothetical protein